MELAGIAFIGNKISHARGIYLRYRVTSSPETEVTTAKRWSQRRNDKDRFGGPMSVR